jgi:predicted nucleic acid-binding Zn finger protein
MEVTLLDDKRIKKDDKLYIKGIRLTNSVNLDYKTDKHISFLVKGDNEMHNVMYFDEKKQDKRWQCDCKWYTLQDKTCSHIIAVNLAIKNGNIGQINDKAKDKKEN